MDQRNERNALLKISAAMMIFGTIGIFRNYIPLSSAMLAFLRGTVGGLFLMVIILLRRIRIKGNPVPFIISGALMGLNWMLLFEAYRYTTVGTATLCYYMQPTIVILLSPLLFKEKLTFRKIICVIAAIIGVTLVSGASLAGGTDLYGILCGLAAACLYASVVILNKKAPPADPYLRTVIQLLAAGIVMLPYLLLKEGFHLVIPDLFTFVMLFIVCFVHTGIAYLLYFSSISGLKAQTLAVLGYIDPVFALAAAAAVLHEPLTFSGIAGAVLIIGAALVSELSEA